MFFGIPQASVGEGVGRHVQDAHDKGNIAEGKRFPILPFVIAHRSGHMYLLLHRCRKKYRKDQGKRLLNIFQIIP